MATLPMLADTQMARIEGCFPRSRGLRRVDDRRVVSGIIYVVRHGLQWREASAGYGPHKTLYNRFVRWSPAGVFTRIFAGLTTEGGAVEQLMADATHLKAHRTAASLRKKGEPPRRIGRTKGGLNSRLHAVCDQHGRPLVMLLTEGQVSDCKGAAGMLPAMPTAPVRIADRGYDADWFRQALRARGTRACIPGRKGRSRAVRQGKVLYRQRHKIEIMFGRLKDWRRIATRYDRCAQTFMSAICIAATVIF